MADSWDHILRDMDREEQMTNSWDEVQKQRDNPPWDIFLEGVNTVLMTERELKMAYNTQSTTSTTNLPQGTNNMSKKYVDLRVKEGKKGKYLSGKLKGTENLFMVFKDDDGINTLHFKESFEGELITIDKFTAKEGNFGPYEFAKNATTGEVYFMSARKDAGELVTNRNGEPVMKQDGSGQLTSAEFTLTIAPKRED